MSSDWRSRHQEYVDSDGMNGEALGRDTRVSSGWRSRHQEDVDCDGMNGETLGRDTRVSSDWRSRHQEDVDSDGMNVEALEEIQGCPRIGGDDTRKTLTVTE